MNKQKAFTLIELLVVVAIIGILAAVGITTFNGFQEKAKASTIKSNHSMVLKYIATEVQKCHLGDSNIMVNNNVSINCNGLNSNSIINYIAASSNSPFDNLKNIYNINSNQQYMSKGIRQHSSWVANLNWQDNDLGFIWLAAKSNDKIHIRTCFKLSCSSSSNRIESFVALN